MREIPKVALLVETSRGFGRDLLCGISRYAQLHGPWSFHIKVGDFEQALPRMKQWGGSGIIAGIPNDRVAKAILEAKLPTIALGLSDEQMQPGSPLCEFSELSSDPVEVASLAANHLLECRFGHFAYVGVGRGRSAGNANLPFSSRSRALFPISINLPKNLPTASGKENKH